jgi:hypothetical protein
MSVAFLFYTLEFIKLTSTKLMLQLQETTLLTISRLPNKLKNKIKDIFQLPFSC